MSVRAVELRVAGIRRPRDECLVDQGTIATLSIGDIPTGAAERRSLGAAQLRHPAGGPAPVLATPRALPAPAITRITPWLRWSPPCTTSPGGLPTRTPPGRPSRRYRFGAAGRPTPEPLHRCARNSSQILWTTAWTPAPFPRPYWPCGRARKIGAVSARHRHPGAGRPVGLAL